jgi:hypothetical protein
MIALILSGVASIHLAEIKKPKILPLGTPNTHFSGFNFDHALLMLAKVFDELRMWFDLSTLLTMRSST